MLICILERDSVLTICCPIMLHRLHKEMKIWALIAWSGSGIWVGCKPDSSSSSSAESPYWADYESPRDKWGFIDNSGTLVIDAEYDAVGTFSEGLAAVNEKGRWGYLDKEGQMEITPQYKAAWAFHEGMARVEDFDNTSQYIDRGGQAIRSDQWIAVDDFSDGLARVQSGSMTGYVDKKGKMVIQPIFTRGWNFEKRIAVVEFEEKLGVIRSSGTNLIPFEYERIKIFPNENIILARKETVSYAFNLEGVQLFQLPDVQFIETDGKLISVRQEEKMFFYDIVKYSSRKELTYKNLVYLGENRWAGKSDDGYKLMDQEENILNPHAFDQLNKFVDGIAVFNRGDAWGFVNNHGVELTEVIFVLAWDYKEGYARAAFTEVIAFIDKNQKLAFYPPVGTMDMRDFSEGLAPVQIHH